MRVRHFLEDNEVPFETLYHPPAYTSQRRAKWLHTSGQSVAKAVLLATPSRYVVAVLPATHHIELETAALRLGEPVRLADEDEIGMFFGDCEAGGVAPFGKLYGLTTILDSAMDPDATVVFAAQRHALAIRMRLRDFQRLEKPHSFAFSSCRTSRVEHADTVSETG